MAAMFFQGTFGNFMHFSAFAGAGSAPGPQGQPPGSYGKEMPTGTAILKGKVLRRLEPTTGALPVRSLNLKKI